MIRSRFNYVTSQLPHPIRPNQQPLLMQPPVVPSPSPNKVKGPGGRVPRPHARGVQDLDRVGRRRKGHTYTTTIKFTLGDNFKASSRTTSLRTSCTPLSARASARQIPSLVTHTAAVSTPSSWPRTRLSTNSTSSPAFQREPLKGHRSRALPRRRRGVPHLPRRLHCHGEALRRDAMAHNRQVVQLPPT